MTTPKLERQVTMDKHFNPRGDSIRSALLGAISGLITVASVLIGVSGADAHKHEVILIGATTLIAGTLAAGFGEYLSVASQRDSEDYDIKREIEDHATQEGRDHELLELQHVYELKGLHSTLAFQVAQQLTEKDAIRAHIDDELRLNPDRLSDPFRAAVISTVTFAAGGSLPFLATIFVHTVRWRIVSCVCATTAGLLIAGGAGAMLGGAGVLYGVARTTVFGWICLGATFGIGKAIGT